MKKIYGIVGHPAGHSLSPAMQNAAFAHLGIEAQYRIFDVPPQGLEDFLSSLAAKEISGLNVTIPHKIEAKRFIGARGVLDKEAAKLGAVNTVKVEGGRLHGYNTDGAGFYRSLVLDLKFEPEGKTVFVLGAGGAATAIVMYLGLGPKRIFVTDVDAAKAEELEAAFKGYFKADSVHSCAAGEIAERIAESDLLINATPLGMREGDPLPVDGALLRRGLSVYDLVYNTPRTALVKEAAMKKLHAVTGAGMLLAQGAIAFEIWTGQKPPLAVMKRALADALKERG